MNGLLLWDIDGTLILGTGVSGRALARFFEKRYGWRDVGRAIRPYGMTDPNIVDGIFEFFGEEPGAKKRDEVLRVYVDMLRDEFEVLQQSRVLPGVPQILTPPRNGDQWLQGLLTGNVREAAKLKLGAVDLWDCFSFGAFGDDAEERRDLVPVAWDRAESLCGLKFSPEQTWVIGDTPRDVEAARAHGVRTILVATNPGVARDSLEACEPYVLLDDLTDYDRFWGILSDNS